MDAPSKANIGKQDNPARVKINHQTVAMANRKLQIVLLFGIGLLIGGCGGGGFKNPDGGIVSLGEYDSVIVEDVRVAATIPKKKMGPLLKGFLQADLKASKEWKRVGDFDLDSFAKFVEDYMTTPGTINGKPIGSAMTREEFTKRYAFKEELQPFLNKPIGNRPVRLRVTINELKFPGGTSQVIMGSKAEMQCLIQIYAPNSTQPIGSAEIKVTESMQGMPILPVGMVINATRSLIAGEYSRKTALTLVTKTSAEIVKQLGKAK